MINEYVLARIEALQQELESLRKVVAGHIESPGCKVRLKGLWKGVEISEEDVEEAQRALFKNAYRFDG